MKLSTRKILIRKYTYSRVLAMDRILFEWMSALSLYLPMKGSLQTLLYSEFSAFKCCEWNDCFAFRRSSPTWAPANGRRTVRCTHGDRMMVQNTRSGDRTSGARPMPCWLTRRARICAAVNQTKNVGKDGETIFSIGTLVWRRHTLHVCYGIKTIACEMLCDWTPSKMARTMFTFSPSPPLSLCRVHVIIIISTH